MGNIPTPTVIASFDIDEITKTLYLNNSPSTGLKKLTSESNPKILTFTTKKGNLISFSHSYNFEVEGTSKGQYIQLEILDPTNEFESIFLTQTLESTVGYTYPELQKDVNNLIKNKPQVPASQIFNGFQDTDIFTPGGGLAPLINFEDRKYKEDLIAWQNKVQLAINNLATQVINKPTLWFMYGISDKFIDWAGPIGGQFYKALYNYNPNNGSRTLTLTFVTTVIETTKIFKKALNINEYAYGESVIGFLDKAAVNDGINTTLKSYFQNILPHTPGNILLATPDFYSLLAKYIQSLKDEVTNSLDAGISTGLNANPSDFRYGIDNRLRNKIVEYALQQGNIPKSTLASITDKPSEFIIKTVTINKLFSDLGFTVTQFEDITQNDNQDGTFNNKDYLEYTINILNKEKKISYFNEFTKIRLVAGDDVTDYMAPINKFIVKFREITGVSLYYYLESDYRILKIWKDRGIIESDKEAAFVLTTEGIKNFYIYGSPLADQEKIKKTLKDGQFFETSSNGNHSISIPIEVPDFILTKFSPEYKKQLFQKIRSYTGNYKFGDLLELPDEYSYSEELDKLVEKNSLPIFRSGYKNSNILDINIEYFSTNYTLELHNYREDTNDVFTAIQALKQEQQLKDKTFDVFNSADLQEIVNKLNHLFNAQVTYGELIDQIKGNPKLYPTSPLELVIAIIKLSKQSTGKKVAMVNEITKQNSIYLKAALADKLAESLQKGIVTTLPFFHLSNNYSITSPVILLMRENKVLGFETDPLLLFSPHTGLWNIYGFKHEIRDSKIDSTFYIVKNIQSLPSELKLNPVTFNEAMKADTNGN